MEERRWRVQIIWLLARLLPRYFDSFGNADENLLFALLESIHRFRESSLPHRLSGAVGNHPAAGEMPESHLLVVAIAFHQPLLASVDLETGNLRLESGEDVRRRRSFLKI